jgi:predicted TIM-barrel fold metal-dependent hydrolase
MIIDCHVHVKGGDIYKREFRPRQILQTMDEAGVDQSVIFSMSLPSRESDDLTRECYEAAPDRFIPFAHVVPDEGEGALQELDRAVGDWGWRGVKIHRGEMAEARLDLLLPIAEKCVALDIPMLIDVGGVYDFSSGLATSVPELKLIVAHLGAPHDEKGVDKHILLAQRHPNLYLDTSYCHVPWKLPEVFARVPAEKLIWGSDGPLIHPAIELRKLEVCQLPADVWRQVTGENLLRVLGPER